MLGQILVSDHLQHMLPPRKDMGLMQATLPREPLHFVYVIHFLDLSFPQFSLFCVLVGYFFVQSYLPAAALYLLLHRLVQVI